MSNYPDNMSKYDLRYVEGDAEDIAYEKWLDSNEKDLTESFLESGYTEEDIETVYWWSFLEKNWEKYKEENLYLVGDHDPLEDR